MRHINPDVWKAYKEEVSSELVDLDEADGGIHLVNTCDGIDPNESVDVGVPGPEPRSLGVAVALMTAVVTHGGQPLLGLMQVPASWALIYGKQASDLFDPCVSLAIGTARLSEFDYVGSQLKRDAPRNKTARRPKQPELSSRRRCVLHKYAEAIRMIEFETVVRLELEHQSPFSVLASSVAESPIFYEGFATADHTWGSGRLLFEEGKGDSPLIDPFAGDSGAEIRSKALR